jgi:alkylresorcinol/alkylpyrone synthase
MTASAKLLALSTALPPHRIPQEAVKDWARAHFEGRGFPIAPLLSAYDNAGIAERRSALPLDWYGGAHGWVERSALYREAGLDLLQEAAERCLEEAGLEAAQVDSLLLVSSTGVATPSLDALLTDRLPFREDLERLPVFGLGCAGGVAGLGQAAKLAEARPGQRVLLLTLELCALNFRAEDMTKGNVIATVLFGDGAAAALISTEGPEEAPELLGSAQHRWPGTAEVMGWRVEEDGLGVVFSRDIPNIIRSKAAPVIERFLARYGLSTETLAHSACHPGGAKVIAALESVLGRQRGELRHERAVLERCGNMSSPTALFVLRDLLDSEPEGLRGPTFSLALGPGFSAALLLLGPGAGL